MTTPVDPNPATRRNGIWEVVRDLVDTAPKKPSQSKLGQVQLTAPQALAPGGIRSVSLTGATITGGDAYPGLGVDLGLTLMGVNDTQVAFPDEDVKYDIGVFTQLISDPADVGKFVGVSFGGNFNSSDRQIPLRDVGFIGGGGLAEFRSTTWDFITLGGLPQGMGFQVDTRELAEDISVTAVFIIVVER